MAANRKNEGAAAGNDIAARTVHFIGKTSFRHTGILDMTAGGFKPTFAYSFPFTFAIA